MNEPDCRVKELVVMGKISESRYINYLMMMEDESGKYR
jgi:putative ribosome biogenesis GTPase RsgA